MFRIRLLSYFFQALVWFFFIATPFFSGKEPFKDSDFLNQYILKQGVCILLFYGNYFYLIPTILKNRGIGIYTLFALLSIGLCFLAYNVLEVLYIRPPQAPFIVIFTIIPVIQIYAISTTFRLVLDYFTQVKMQKELEEQNRSAELNFLRSQINPHFLFNTLNNINALIRLQPSEAEKAVGTLSELMRYMLQCIKDPKIEIGKEVKYLQNYIALQKLRLQKDFKLALDFQISNAHTLIEPMLLISFIENTFKHGVSGDSDDFISIKVNVTEKELLIETENKLLELGSTNAIISGVGMANVKRRLELCYPGKYELFTSKDKGVYAAHLKIYLS